MGFLRYILELVFIMYIVRIVMRFLDSSFSTKPVQQNTQQTSKVNTTTNQKSKSFDGDYIDYEEVK